MTVSPEGREFIKRSHGFKANAWKDPNRRAYCIGYGSYRMQNGYLVKLQQRITEAEATDLMNWQIDNDAALIWRRLSDIDLSQNQFDALVAWCYGLNSVQVSRSRLLKQVRINKDDPYIRICFLMEHNSRKALTRLDQLRAMEQAKLYFNNFKPGRWGWDHRRKTA